MAYEPVIAVGPGVDHLALALQPGIAAHGGAAVQMIGDRELGPGGARHAGVGVDQAAPDELGVRDRRFREARDATYCYARHVC